MTTLADLNKHLFAQLERLSTVAKEDLEIEVVRTQTLESISKQIIKAHNTQLDAVRLVAEYKGVNHDQKTPLINFGDIEVGYE